MSKACLHYARTLDHWSERLEDNLEAAGKLVPDQALRIWRLYLAGCAYAFAGAGSTCTRFWR
jgi:cyclopropane-fatty-acyl-phospholipid synthase